MVDPQGTGKRLRAARQAAKCSAQELAEKLGVSKNYLLRVERGDELPPKQLSLERIRAACRILGVSADWLLGMSRRGGPKKARRGV